MLPTLTQFHVTHRLTLLSFYYIFIINIYIYDYFAIYILSEGKLFFHTYLTLETYNYALNGHILPSIKHFKLAVKNDILKNNPINKVDRPSTTYEAGQVYNSVELKLLHHLLDQEEKKQMIIMIKLAMLTGMRKGELLALKWDDVDFSTNTININQSLSYTKKHGYQLKEPKTKGSIRKVAPPSRFMSEFKKHIHIKRQEKFATAEKWNNSFGDLVFSTFGKDDNDKMSLFGKPIHLNSPNR